MSDKKKFIDSPPVKNDNADTLRIGAALAFVIAASILGVRFFGGHIFPKEKLLVSLEKTDGQPPQKPYLPDISGITVEAVEKMVPPLEKGKILFDRIDLYPEYAKFLEGDAPRHLRLIQRRINPMALVVFAGNYDWKSLYQEVHAFDPEGKIIHKEGFVYTLRVPLLVMYGASLAITGKDVSELRLSKQSNAFIVNAGDLFVIKTRVIGWNEETKDLTHFIEKRDFRPFLTNWDGGNMYLAGTFFSSLGYLKGKSYGISYSGCTPCEKVTPGRPPATGIVVGNTFTDMYYGFYSYEAEDVKIIGNTYYDNVIYGIDPHDRSRRLVIAKNETYNTHKKHGIIVSREVDDSWIFDNYSHDNHGSGIMIDRTSINNVVANNLCEHNNQDGLTFFESQDNITWGNTLRNNKKNGVRIRNSWNIKLNNDEIVGNGGTAIELYTADLSDQKTRDFEMDPYTAKANVIINGAKISTSGAAVFKVTDSELMGITNTKVRAATHMFPVSYAYNEDMVRDNIGKKDVMVKVQNQWFRHEKPQKPPHHAMMDEDVTAQETP